MREGAITAQQIQTADRADPGGAASAAARRRSAQYQLVASEWAQAAQGLP
ncbi:hypothetical protein GCM10011612_17980 [Actinomyces gaoshouyii]|uniref:Uncharacterized protein n=1 Tax=Actinomyces gaoshouyii TaxID=1960083 RepID=A0A8H9LFH6_9ACTO|nr:hypothetical protein GCM10011612_17980 [Actinomyces gaoshouyii]